jgi:transposase
MHHRKSLGLRNNTDALAAQALAVLGVERRPAPYEALPKEYEALRALTRYRDQVVARRTALKNRIQEPAPSAWVRRRERAELKHLDAEVARVEKALREHVKAHPALAHDVKLLETVQGVGFITAVVVLAEGGDLTRFTKARQLGAYAGLSPAHNDSGTSVHGRARLCKKGNARIRQALYLAAVTTIRCDNDFARFYRRLCEAGKEPMVALAAVMRKMLLVLRALLIADKPYDPHRQSGGKRNPNTEENTTKTP